MNAMSTFLLIMSTFTAGALTGIILLSIFIVAPRDTGHDR